MADRAAVLIRNLADEIGEALDEPVLEYLAGLLVVAATDSSEIESFGETLAEFLPGSLDRHPDSTIQSLVNKMNSTSGGPKASPPPSPATGPGDQTRNLEEGVGDLSTAVASIKLNVEAKEFVPAFLDAGSNNDNDLGGDPLYECYTDEADLELEEEEGFDQSMAWLGGGGGSVDSLGILSCLFPAFSQGALQSLLEVNNGDLRESLRALSQMDSQCGPCIPVEAPPPRVVDMSEESFPSLSPAVREPPMQNQPARRKNFAAAARKGAACKEPVNGGQFGGMQKGGRDWARKGKIIPWVSTGEEVSEQYAKAREEAREFALMRNSCFERATKAYMAGKKAQAKELGAEGRWYCAKMKECHSIAAEGIFFERNERFRSGGSGGGVVIDLHGLHVSEARLILKRELHQLYQERKPQIVSLLVGTGHHTKGSRTPSRLPGAVRQFLEEEGYPHQTKDAGVIDVRL
ncbi:hypothetical protein BSKO_10557 [Bryopsis sp. KO-2023]|nr:hypothetical protein BSKO_10557 [Bryopsis sp. KO-2023]